MSQTDNVESVNLILAAEDCGASEFDNLHRFSPNDERVISKLIAHGPVLLEGGRGSGKSALMIAASHRLAPYQEDASVFGVYLSLRYLPLLRTSGREYEEIFCRIVSNEIQQLLRESSISFETASDVASLQYSVAKLSRDLGKRIVLLFDDAAHIGRETSLGDFFDIFRTLSSSTVSCKATIYPGVTNFGTRFDVYNDATVINVVRDEDQSGFEELFAEILKTRFPMLINMEVSAPLTVERVAGFLAKSVLGNMRGFIFACNELSERCTDKSVGLTSLGETILDLAMNYYWPLLEEVSPKLGKYIPMVDPARQIGEILVRECGKNAKRSALIHRDIIARMQKPFEILEYVGFTSKRDSSRALKSGGRGSRFAINLCILLENVPGARLTSDLFDKWAQREEPVELHSKSPLFSEISTPVPDSGADLKILEEPIGKLRKSQAYPYGLTEHMIGQLKNAGKVTVGDLSRASDEELGALSYIGAAKIRRMRSVLGQAIWM